MAEICVIEDKNFYYQVSKFDSGMEDFGSIFQKIEYALREKMQDVVLSLAAVKVLYSSHLAMFVRINQLLRKNNLRFALTDISPEVKNLLQITQLDSIFQIYESLEEFKKSSMRAEKGVQAETDFEWQIVKDSENSVSVICKGNMTESKSLDELQKTIMDFYSISFDFSKLQSMDQASLNFLEKIVDKHSIQISGASQELVELFRQKLIYGKIKFL
ncbi:MAG: STAS domain-containing protein [Fibromonadaceae bacterium]|nr:STAS domain-containing protein [Fibromonadaceae bacterium]